MLAGCHKDGIVLDPFFGSGTTGMVAMQHNRNFVGIELNPENIEQRKDYQRSNYSISFLSVNSFINSLIIPLAFTFTPVK
ncbi:site-specific DNA-methyltransferase [Chengkuizengella sediminis]|nr:site-specific DNA-methyltransferase [Chengkuizengella sediminis]